MPTATSSRARPRAGAQAARQAVDETTEVARRSADRVTQEARDVASTAAGRGGALAQEVKQDARQLAGTVRERAGEVTGELAVQGRSLAEDAVAQLKQQGQSGAMQLADGFRQLGEEAQALAEGRSDEAPRLQPYVYKAADGLYGAAESLYRMADDVETRGVGAVLDDLQQFARRRPGAFLLGAAVVGFGVGRLVKVQRDAPDTRSPEVDQHADNGRRELGRP